MKVEAKKVQSKNGNIYYWVSGSECPNVKCIIFVHGMMADHSMFDKQVIYFDKKFKVVTIDVPLHGKSRPYINYSHQYVADEIKKIMDSENLSKVILVGQSMGGYICQEFAVKYPHRVLAFVAVDTSPLGDSYYGRWERFVLSKVIGVSSLFTYNYLIKVIAKASTRTDYAFTNIYNSVSKLSKNEMIHIMTVCYNDFLIKRVAVKFHFPVLLIIGEKDKIGNLKKYNIKWATREGYPLSIIDSAAHNSNADNYNEFNSVLDSFLSVKL